VGRTRSEHSDQARAQLHQESRIRDQSARPEHLSSHRNEPTEEDAAANRDFHLFAKEEDELIVEWVNRIGNRRKRITEIHARRFPPREKLQIKHRAKVLMENLANASGMTQALAEVEVAPAQGNEQGGFDPETLFAVTEERPAFADLVDSTI
jgi:hypothetical protein